MFQKDTIAAIATAMTSAGIGIIRVSGPDAVDICDRVYRGKQRLSEVESHTVHYGHIVWEDDVIDEVMVLVLRAPRTYTREDTVEIDCHGGILVMEKILEAVLRSGARPAEPGEFTKRAFLNGRIDLSQAESVMDVISSSSDYALKNSMHQLNGMLSDQIKDMREKILYEIAYIESALDDTEHYDLTGYEEELQVKVEGLIEKIQHLVDTSDQGAILREGVRTVIVGKPNAGKSSLMNVLARKERAIVTDIAGTTRDTLEEQIRIHGITLNIVDTAGIRDTDDVVEQIGVEKAMESIEDADLILYVVDGAAALDKNDLHIMEKCSGHKTIALLNKSDLKTQVTEKDIKDHLDAEVISFSAKDQTGLENLEERIKDMFFSGSLDMNQEIFITNARQKHALQMALESLQHTRESIMDHMPEDFFSIDLMEAYEQLGYIIGESLEDDLVNEIFSKFCMGK